MKVYKLTDKNMQTFRGFQWFVGETYETSAHRHSNICQGLCSASFLHWYEDPALALFMNGVHGNFNPSSLRMFEAEADGTIIREPLKGGSTQLTLTKEITDFAYPTTEQFVRFGILTALQVADDVDWKDWANKWLSGEDRTVESAEGQKKKDISGWAHPCNIAAYAAYYYANDVDVDARCAATNVIVELMHPCHTDLRSEVFLRTNVEFNPCATAQQAMTI